VSARHAAAIGLWAAAWACSGFIVAAWFAAKNGKRDIARAELAIGLIGGGGLALIGAWVW
jgi:type IV secretory pathway TrbD component